MNGRSENMIPKILLAVNINPQNYVNAVTSCGASADAVYNPTIDMTDYDGLILCGGNDINPVYYGETIEGAVNIDDFRDKCEIALAREYIKMQKQASFQIACLFFLERGFNLAYSFCFFRLAVNTKSL